MLGTLEKFGNLHIARRAGGDPVELVRSPDEVTFLAFDQQIERLVELHVLKSGGSLDTSGKKSAFERARLASEIRGPTFLRILEVGEDDGWIYYTSNLNDGEFAEDYVARRGAVAAPTALSMVYQLLDDLLKAWAYQRLVARMRLDRVLVSTLEDTFLHLRIFDYGLSAKEQIRSQETGDRDLVLQVSRLLFLLLTGQKYTGQNPDAFLPLTSLPMSLRTTIRTSLTDPGNAPTSLEKVRDDVREAFGALVSSIQARNTRKQLVVIPELQPRSQLQDLLLENVPIETILGRGFRVDGDGSGRRYPFSIPAVSLKSQQEVTVHLLPPARIIAKALYEAVPLQMWRFNSERHPNILRSLSVWESPDWTFLTEERSPGFPLSRLMAERMSFNPSEILVLLKQVASGIEQAVDCGVPKVDLHPSNILLQVGKPGPTLQREHERLMQKRIDAWPPFLVKLRPHLTMRSLYEPLLVERPSSENAEEHLAERDFRHRSFVALAAYLMTGDRQMGDEPHFSEAVPASLAEYVGSCLKLARQSGKTPPPAEFLAKFEEHMNAPEGPDLATRLRGAEVPVEEMESVGAVSDFDDDWSAPAPVGEPDSYVYYGGKGGGGWIGLGVVAAAVVAAVGGVSWWLLADRSELEAQGDEPSGKVASAPPSGSQESGDAVPAISPPDESPAAEMATVSPPSVQPEKGSPPPESAQVVEGAISRPGARIAATTETPVRPPKASEPRDDADPSSAPASVPPSQPTPPSVGLPAPVAKAEPREMMDSKRGGKPTQSPVDSVPDPVIIRKAILPSPEEIEKLKETPASEVTDDQGRAPSSSGEDAKDKNLADRG